MTEKIRAQFKKTKLSQYKMVTTFAILSLIVLNFYTISSINGSKKDLKKVITNSVVQVDTSSQDETLEEQLKKLAEWGVEVVEGKTELVVKDDGSKIDILVHTCKDKGMKHNDIDKCVIDLLKLCGVESGCRNDAKSGDLQGIGADYIGPYQISSIHNNINDRNDFEQSAIWTLDRMLRNGYAWDPLGAIGDHNSYNPEISRPYEQKVANFNVLNLKF